MVGIMLPGALVVAVFAVAHAERLNTPSSFMLVGGVSATSEMCLTALENVGAALSDCGAAVAELDGREIWSLSAGGALTSFASKQCLAVPSGAVAGATVALAPCDGRWVLILSLSLLLFIANLKRSWQVDGRVCHRHQCPQDRNRSTDWSFCAWRETSFEKSSGN